MAQENDDMKEPEEEKIDEVDELKMSRTSEPEYIVKFDKIRDKVVFDGQGNKIKFGEIYKYQKTIIIFVRHFLDYITRDYVEDIAAIPLEYLQAAGIRLVVIGPAPYHCISEFKKETGLQYTLYCDPDRELYELLELSTKYEPVDTSKSKHVKQGSFMGFMSGLWKIMKVKEWRGDIKQQGGTFILGPGDVVHYTHIDKHQADHAPINDILTQAGVQQVSFPKDPRVLNL